MRFALLLTLTLLLPACAGVTRFEKGAFVAFGSQMEGSEEPLFYLMRMDLSRPAPEGTPVFTLKLPGSTAPVPWDRLTAEAVSARLPKFVPPEVWPEQWKVEAAKRDAYEGGGIYISFRDGRIEYLGVCSHCGKNKPEPAPEMGPPEGEMIFRLPLSREELVRVVGEPDRVYKVMEVRY